MPLRKLTQIECDKCRTSRMLGTRQATTLTQAMDYMQVHHQWKFSRNGARIYALCDTCSGRIQSQEVTLF